MNDDTDEHGYRKIQLSDGEFILIAQNTYLNEPLDKIIKREEKRIAREKADAPLLQQWAEAVMRDLTLPGNSVLKELIAHYEGAFIFHEMAHPKNFDALLTLFAKDDPFHGERLMYIECYELVRQMLIEE